MSDDIVARLRERARYDGWATEDVLSGEAADEITRLRAELAAERDRNGIITQAAQEVTNALRANLAAVTAERDRMQISHDEAYIAGMKHGWNCCAAGHEERYKRTVENTREQIRRARAALEGVTEQERQS